MKNHEIVPVQLIASIARLKFGGTPKAVSELLKNKLVFHDAKRCEQYFSFLPILTVCLQMMDTD
jgi:RIO kinase 2